MLKNIPSNISPELMHVLMSMGHSDEIVIADGNFPAASCAKNCLLIRADGLDLVSLLESVMKFFPIDKYVDDNAVVMKLEKSDEHLGTPPIWKDFERVLHKEEGEWVKITPIDRHEFYERAKKAFAVVATSETAIYANIILKKGVVVPPK